MKIIQNTIQSPSFFLGIDVGKRELHCHMISPFEVASDKFDNTTKGINSLIAWVKKRAELEQLSACLE